MNLILKEEQGCIILPYFSHKEKTWGIFLKIDGFSDHLVSEAIYIRDPDHIGIEIYRDRPHTEWTWNKNQAYMTLDHLDMQGLLSESDKPWTEFPTQRIKSYKIKKILF